MNSFICFKLMIRLSLDSYSNLSLVRNCIYLLFFSRSFFLTSTRGIFLTTIVTYSLTILPSLIAFFSNNCGTVKLRILYVPDTFLCFSCLITSSFASSIGIDIDLFFPFSIQQAQKSNMMEQTCLNRNFCSFTGFLLYLPQPMSAKCINK